MNDTPDFRSIAEEAVESNEVKENSTEQTPAPEAEVKVEVVEPKTETQAEEQFTHIDPKTLSPELQAVYKSLQADYTKKRQATEAKVRAELEAKYSQQVQPQVTVEQKAEEAQQALNLGQMTVAQYTEYMKGLAAEQAREVAREEYKSMIAEEREQQLQEKALSDFEGADPRLSEFSPSYNESFRNEVQRELAELLDKHLEENGGYQGFDSATLTKQIVERRDKEIDEIIKKRTLESTQAAKMRDAKARKSEVRGSTSNGQSVNGSSIRNILSEVVDNAA